MYRFIGAQRVHFWYTMFEPNDSALLAGQVEQGNSFLVFHIIQIAYFVAGMTRPILFAGWQAGAENGESAWNCR